MNKVFYLITRSCDGDCGCFSINLFITDNETIAILASVSDEDIHYDTIEFISEFTN